MTLSLGVPTRDRRGDVLLDGLESPEPLLWPLRLRVLLLFEPALPSVEIVVTVRINGEESCAAL